jgi:ATPase family protein associated with various cellular activities (AAA)
MDYLAWSSTSGLPPHWLEPIRIAAKKLGLDFDPVPVRGWLTGSALIATVRSLGGTIEPAAPFHGWILAKENDGTVEPISRFAPELVATEVHVADFNGVVAIELDGDVALALRINEQVFPGQMERALILAGRSLDATLALASRLKAGVKTLFRQSLRVYGTGMAVSEKPAVTEDDLVLPAGLKYDLLSYVDGFWRSAVLCAQMRIAPTRGLLFAGAPGTGKTLTVRHLLTRYPDRQSFVFMAESAAVAHTRDSVFREMVQEVAAAGAPAIVVLEDVDRLLESGVVTAEFFLNVLDGLFQPQQPVLWIATSNDPTRLEPNLLDRPGRFDRVFIFPTPGPEERARLIERYSPWPVRAEVVQRIAGQAEGLTGAHLREVCYGAAFAALKANDQGFYEVMLREELDRVKRQHSGARNCDLNQRNEAGFRR